MSELSVRSISGKDGTPVMFPDGISIGAGAPGGVNNIGIAGQQGFGLGVCPGPLPSGMAALFGYSDPSSDNYATYMYNDGSIMTWIPAFYYKFGTGANGLAINQVSIKAFSEYADVATANAAGYALHRAFYDGGAVQPGFFRDKYVPSNNGGVASSIKNGIALTSAVRGGLANTAFASLNGAPSNSLGGAFAAAKTRGANFFPSSGFIDAAIAMLTFAHAQASTSTTYCAWYNATYNFPKGNNDNALGDTNDGDITYVHDGNATYAGVGKTGSANLFARTTHNGQNSGIADVNGLIYRFCPGLCANGTHYFLLNTSVAMKDLTGSNTLATDAFGATGLAAMYTNIGATYGALTGSATTKLFGAATQVFSEATSGTAWGMAGFGIPLLAGTGGTNPFGSDGLYDPATPTNELAPLSSADWANASNAGVWYRLLSSPRSNSGADVGFASALYL